MTAQRYRIGSAEQKSVPPRDNCHQEVAVAYLEGGRGPPPQLPIAQEIFAPFKYPNIGKDTS